MSEICRPTHLLFFSVLLLFLPVLASAAALTVPEQYPRIQIAINAAADGDVVVVSPGTYNECINFEGKAITVRSTNATNYGVVSATIIRGDDSGSEVVAFNHSETSTSVLRGFSISGNEGNGNGGGIRCEGASPVISNNIISGNSALQGGGVACDNGSSPLLTGNSITGNTATLGGGVFCSFSSCPTLTNNNISGNTATSPGFYGGGGGGMFCTHDASPILINNTVSNNSGGGIYPENGSSPVIKNTIVAFNTGGGGLYVGDPFEGAPNPMVTYCNFYGNTGGDYVNWPDQTGTNGNISLDPLFANAAGGDYGLKSKGGRWTGSAWVADAASSPCIDAGDPTSTFSNEPSPNGGRINMGYDGNTAYASKSGDGPAPTIVAAGPSGTTVGVAANINITFSEVMARPTAQNAMTINGVRASTFGGTFSWVGRKMIFNPTNNLQPGTEYKIIIAKGAKSRAGRVSMARGFMWTFTTKPAAAAAVTVASQPTALGAQIIVNLASAAEVTVSVRNLAGREVAVLQPGLLEAGARSLLWNGRSSAGTKVPAGIYLVQVTARGTNGTVCSAIGSLRK
ncbi:MAG: Ig-like domain-containing protein [Armatimonadota bacterium]